MMRYWEERALQLEKANFKQSEEYIGYLSKQYNQAVDELNLKMYNHLKDMADINNISLAEAKQYMNNKDLRLWKTSLKDYTEKAQQTMSEELNRELQTISKRVRISRLQAMKTDIKMTVDKLLNEEQRKAFETISSGYENQYYNLIYDMQKVTGYEVIEAIDKKKLDIILNKPWTADDVNFSKRIWKKKDKLINTLHSGLTQSLAGGTSISELSKKLEKEFEVSKKQAERLIRTEMAATRSQATQDGYRDLGVEQYQILATLDSRTSDTCRYFDLMVFDMKDYQVGVTAPPFHVNCRSTTIPYIEGLTDDGTRVARDPITGKSVKVVSKKSYKFKEVEDGLSYEDWYKKYVEFKDVSLE